MVVVIRRESRRITFFYSSGTIPDEEYFYSLGMIPDEYILFIRRGTIQTNKIMYLGILFNSCFSLFNSFIEMIKREIHSNKEFF